MKPLDIVRTPKGNIGWITETNRGGKDASIQYIGAVNPDDERNAWWHEGELEVIDTIPQMLASALPHPFGNGRDDAEKFYPNEKAPVSRGR